MAKTSRESYKFQLRLPDDLRDRVRQAAEDNGRTLTSEIIETLTEKYPPTTLDEIKKRVAEIIEFLNEMEPGEVPLGMHGELDALLKKLNDAKGIMG